MPSEDKIFEALEGPYNAFHSALASTLEVLRPSVEAGEATSGDAEPRSGTDLGKFAQGRIDLDRFESTLSRDAVVVKPDVSEASRQAFDVLTALAARGNDICRVEVESGANLWHAVAAAYARIGRAYGASRVAELSRVDSYEKEKHAAMLEGYAFAQWNAAERGLAPPLVVHLDGADLKAGSLADFLDGGAKIVLVVRGDAPPAALARLVSPGVFVMQTKSEADLERFAAFKGPGVAAFVPDGAALFAHDPDGGETVTERIVVQKMPEWPSNPLGSISVFQQAEGLRQLEALTVAGTATESDEKPTDPVDKLAAWLLTRADLAGLE